MWRYFWFKELQRLGRKANTLHSSDPCLPDPGWVFPLGCCYCQVVCFSLGAVQAQAHVHFWVAVGGGTFGTWKFPDSVNIIMSCFGFTYFELSYLNLVVNFHKCSYTFVYTQKKDCLLSKFCFDFLNLIWDTNCYVFCIL